MSHKDPEKRLELFKKTLIHPGIYVSIFTLIKTSVGPTLSRTIVADHIELFILLG